MTTAVEDPEPPERIGIFAKDQVSQPLTEAAGLQTCGTDGTEGARVSDKNGRLAADVRPDGSVFVHVEGRGFPGQVDELSACQILMNTLDPDRARWGEPYQRKGREDGVDVEAPSLTGGKSLRFQVTRIDPDPDLWRNLTRMGSATKYYPSVAAVADALQKAIAKKKDKPKAGIILVLNGTQLPLGLRSVRAAFEQRYGDWANNFGFDEIWIVESFLGEGWTFRIAGPPSPDSHGSESTLSSSGDSLTDTVDPPGPKEK
jgi:hypothetical protein